MGDANGDGSVNIFDLSALANEWGQSQDQNSDKSYLLMDPVAVKAHIANGDQPFKDGYSKLITAANSALNNTPNVYAGLEIGTDPHIYDSYQDAKWVRTLALAYALSGNTTYRDKARSAIEAWASGNTPRPCTGGWGNGTDTGQMQGLTYWPFAYATSLVYDTPPVLVTDWGNKIAYSMKDCLINQELKNINSYGTTRLPYAWHLGMTESRADYARGGDFVLFELGALSSWANLVGDKSTRDWAFDPSNPVGAVQSIHSSLEPDNDGDTLGTIPAPQKNIVYSLNPVQGPAYNNDGPTKTTYNARIAHLLAIQGESLGYGTLTRYTPSLKHTWGWLGSFCPPNNTKIWPDPSVNNATAWDPNKSRFMMGLFLEPDNTHFKEIIGTTASTASDSQIAGPLWSLLP
jgi:hypothetical protein